jgi:hypothetical protein
MAWRLLHWRMLPSLKIGEVELVTGISAKGVLRMVRSGELERVEGTRLIRTESVVRRFGVAPLDREPDTDSNSEQHIKAATRREAADFIRRAQEKD